MSGGRRALALYHSLPEKLRMVLTAILGALTGLVTYEILYLLNPFEPRATIAWTVSFLLGVTRQHGLATACSPSTTLPPTGPAWDGPM